MASVPMLLYHKVGPPPAGSRHPEISVTPERFAAHLSLLRALGRTPIAVSRYVAYRRGEAALPPRPVVITFDDGYLDNYEHALPVLQRFGAPATIFLVSERLGMTNAWDAHEPQVPLLDAARVREMQRAGIDFQSHTATHARLTHVPPAAALDELRRSRASLEQLLGAPVDVVAYPWGAHDDTVLRLAEDAGYAAGAIVRRRANFDHTPMLALRRIPVYDHTSTAQIAWDLFRLRWRGE
jgi:peptidoglycan/xylan/chitin deacetylase (PgdA/CDA1 family)